MSLPVSVPYAFANATTTQNLSSLDANFNALANGLNGLANGASQISVSSISATGTANATTYLRGDGTWATVSGGGGNGTVTSVNANSSVSGFSFTGGPVTSSGTLTFTGPAPGTSGNVLTSNGTSWISGSVSTPQGAKAWVNFNGGAGGVAGTIYSSYNVSSITVNGTGNYTVNFSTALSTNTYAIFASGLRGTAVFTDILTSPQIVPTSTSACQVAFPGSTGTSGAATSYSTVVIFGN